MLAIGEFSRMTHPQHPYVAALPRGGVARAGVVDASSGYRYYSGDQIPIAQVIHRCASSTFHSPTSSASCARPIRTSELHWLLNTSGVWSPSWLPPARRSSHCDGCCPRNRAAAGGGARGARGDGGGGRG